MKEFEKWYNHNIRPYIHDPRDKEIVKCGWKAALEWTLTTQGRFDHRFCPMISPSIIEKELKSVE